MDHEGFVLWAVNDRLFIKRLQVPPALAAGLLENLTKEELIEHYHDIRVELQRRGV
jgi:Mn-dependent DtxR family transcriptional regulator